MPQRVLTEPVAAENSGQSLDPTANHWDLAYAHDQPARLLAAALLGPALRRLGGGGALGRRSLGRARRLRRAGRSLGGARGARRRAGARVATVRVPEPVAPVAATEAVPAIRAVRLRRHRHEAARGRKATSVHCDVGT